MSCSGGQSIGTATDAVTVGGAELLAETRMVLLTGVLLAALAVTTMLVFAPPPATLVLNFTWFGSFALFADCVGTTLPFTVMVMPFAPVAVPVTGIVHEVNTWPSVGEVTVRLSVPGTPT